MLLYRVSIVMYCTIVSRLYFHCSERETFAKLVEDVVWYTPSEHNLHHYGDGGVAIIDQWIAAHAKFFIGTK